MTDEESGIGTISPTLQTLARRAEPVVIETEGFGSVGFGQIKREVSAELPDLLAIEDDREFAIQFTHRLIVGPIPIEEWQQLSDADLIGIIEGLGARHRAVKRHYSLDDKNDPLSSFRAAVIRYSKYEKERFQQIGSIGSIAQIYLEDLQASINPILSSAFSDAAAISTLGNTLSSQALEFAGAAALLNNQLAVDLDPMRMALESFQQSNLEYQNSLLSAFQGITDVWQSIQPDLFTRLQSSYSNLDFDLEAYNTSLSETNEILKKYHWFISPSMPATFVRYIKEIHYNSGSHRRREMNRLFIQYITYQNYSNLRAMFADWKKNPLFAPRMAIIRASLDVLRTARASHNPSNVVIPALLTQVDGIMCDFLEDRGVELRNGRFYAANSKQSKKAEHILKDLIEASNADRKETTDTTRRLVDGFEPDKYLLFDVLFQGGRRGENLRRPTTFNRHKIVHGETIRYGRMENTVKAYLILDYLAYIDTEIPKANA